MNLTETKFFSDEMPYFARIGKILQCVVVILGLAITFLLGNPTLEPGESRRTGTGNKLLRINRTTSI